MLISDMTYGQIAESNNTTEAIYRYFRCIREEDQRAFVKKFAEQPHDKDQVMHTFRELIVGAVLASYGLKVKYDECLDGKTPDWSILDADGKVQYIVELFNFHTDKATENKIKQDFQNKHSSWNWQGSHAIRLHDRVREKASKYKPLVEQLHIAYVIALFGESTANVELKDVQECLFDKENGLFALYPVVSGLLFFEGSGGYRFRYIRNPRGTREIDLPCDFFFWGSMAQSR